MNTKTEVQTFHYALGANFLYSLMFLRVYFIVRTCMNYTVYQELYAQKICHKHGFLSNAGFCIKALILKVPGKTIVLTCVISVASLAYVLRLYEREYYRQLDEDHSNLLFESYITAIWCVIITMTTVGYGDVFAVSTFGRIVSIINALWGAFIISLLVSSIGKIFELSEN